jgi:1-phosphofructokinase
VSPTVVVLAPDPLLTVTVEAGPDGDEVHLHPGGQGFWIAKMAAALGAQVTLCGPFGGETGAVVRDLMARADVALAAVEVAGSNGSYVHDRRDGERVEIATMRPTALSRHDLDDLYGAALTGGLAADVTVLAGPGPWDPLVVPAEMYRRLVHDLSSNGRAVVADLSGEPLTQALAGGLRLLKLSHEELPGAPTDPHEVVEAMHALRKAGAQDVVVSRAGDPALALVGERVVEIRAPRLEAVDHRGAGDSMTAGLAVALGRGDDVTDALRFGAAAGALNVTRHGLASGDREGISSLAHQVEIVDLEEDT